ncbi:hypothetical protein JCM16106_00420 [Hydrogenophilus islandicus]|jgi:AmmeMemoRadiSam system protein A
MTTTRRESPFVIDDGLGQVLLAHARAAISEALTGQTVALPDDPRLDHFGATFVTLTRKGALRGCIGSLEAHRPLRDDVRANALAAAFTDPRFPPLTLEEWPEIAIEVSLLSPPEAILFRDEAELLAQLRPHRDGLIIAAGPYRATFLPQVWSQLPSPEDFLAALKSKAGLNPYRPTPGLQAWRYTVTAWHEPAQLPHGGAS